MPHAAEGVLSSRTASCQQTFQRSACKGNPFSIFAACDHLPGHLSAQLHECASFLCFRASLSTILSLSLFSCLFHLSGSSLISLVYFLCLSFLSPGPSLSLPPFLLPDAVSKPAHRFFVSRVVYGPGSAQEMLSGVCATPGAGVCKASSTLGPQATISGTRSEFLLPSDGLVPHRGPHRRIPGSEPHPQPLAISAQSLSASASLSGSASMHLCS